MNLWSSFATLIALAIIQSLMVHETMALKNTLDDRNSLDQMDLDNLKMSTSKAPLAKDDLQIITDNLKKRLNRRKRFRRASLNFDKTDEKSQQPDNRTMSQKLYDAFEPVHQKLDDTKQKLIKTSNMVRQKLFNVYQYIRSHNKKDTDDDFPIEQMLHEGFTPVQKTIQDITESLVSVGGDLRDKTYNMYMAFESELKRKLKNTAGTTENGKENYRKASRDYSDLHREKVTGDDHRESSSFKDANPPSNSHEDLGFVVVKRSDPKDTSTLTGDDVIGSTKNPSTQTKTASQQQQDIQDDIAKLEEALKKLREKKKQQTTTSFQMEPVQPTNPTQMMDGDYIGDMNRDHQVNDRIQSNYHMNKQNQDNYDGEEYFDRHMKREDSDNYMNHMKGENYMSSDDRDDMNYMNRMKREEEQNYMNQMNRDNQMNVDDHTNREDYMNRDMNREYGHMDEHKHEDEERYGSENVDHPQPTESQKEPNLEDTKNKIRVGGKLTAEEWQQVLDTLHSNNKETIRKRPVSDSSLDAHGMHISDRRRSNFQRKTYGQRRRAGARKAPMKSNNPWVGSEESVQTNSDDAEYQHFNSLREEAVKDPNMPKKSVQVQPLSEKHQQFRSHVQGLADPVSDSLTLDTNGNVISQDDYEDYDGMRYRGGYGLRDRKEPSHEWKEESRQDQLDAHRFALRENNIDTPASGGRAVRDPITSNGKNIKTKPTSHQQRLNERISKFYDQDSKEFIPRGTEERGANKFGSSRPKTPKTQTPQGLRNNKEEPGSDNNFKKSSQDSSTEERVAIDQSKLPNKESSYEELESSENRINDLSSSDGEVNQKKEEEEEGEDQLEDEEPTVKTPGIGLRHEHELEEEDDDPKKGVDISTEVGDLEEEIDDEQEEKGMNDMNMDKYEQASDVFDAKQLAEIQALAKEWNMVRKKMRKLALKKKKNKGGNDKKSRPKPKRKLIDGGDINEDINEEEELKKKQEEEIKKTEKKKNEKKENEKKESESDKSEDEEVFDYAEDNALDSFNDKGEEPRDTYIDTTKRDSSTLEQHYDDSAPDLSTEDEKELDYLERLNKATQSFRRFR
eukprot:TCONS_00011565-protein